MHPHCCSVWGSDPSSHRFEKVPVRFPPFSSSDPQSCGALAPLFSRDIEGTFPPLLFPLVALKYSHTLSRSRFGPMLITVVLLSLFGRAIDRSRTSG
jgi:hypothetical protein